MKLLNYAISTSLLLLSLAPGKLLAQERLNQDFCNQSRSTCNGLVYASQAIDLTYKYGKGNQKDDQQVVDRLYELGWKNGTFTEVQSIPIGKDKNGKTIYASDAQAFTGKTVVNGKTYYLISFRGTQETQDIGIDLSTTQVGYNGTKVHSGFLKYTSDLSKSDSVSSFIKDIKANRGDYEVLVTGHSLGGAAAMVFSAMLQEENVPKERINNIVFGAPSPGDSSFASRYLDTTIRANIDTDVVPVSTILPSVWSIFASLVRNFGLPFGIDPDIYAQNYGREIKISLDPNKTKKLIDNLKDKLKCTNPIDCWTAFTNIPGAAGEFADYLKASHLDYQDRVMAIYQKEREERIAKLNNISSLDRTSCITFFNSSHVGSASCFFAGTSEADNFFGQQVSQNTVQIPSIQQQNQYTDGQIVKANLDIGLTWNQDTKLDLDSHLVLPQGDHIYFNNRGQLNGSPNAFLYRDSIPDPGVPVSNGATRAGAEQTRIQQFQSGQYRFYVHNYSDFKNTTASISQGKSGLSNSSAVVQIFEGGKDLSNIPNDPNGFDLNNVGLQNTGKLYPGVNSITPTTGQTGNTWYVFKLDTRTGVLYRINRFGDAARPSLVPTAKFP